MEIIVNGEVQLLEKSIPITVFLQEKDIDPATVIVELNTNILKSSDYPDTMLMDKDHLEILRFVGGG